MANINTNPSGKVLTANGIVVLNNVSDVDPRKAVVFDSRQDALDGIDAAQGYNRVENLILYYKENGKTVAGIFDGGIADENFIPFGENTSKWELIQENPYNLKVPTEAEWLAETGTWITQDSAGAFDSVLKLTIGGRRHDANGVFGSVGFNGFYWSSGASSNMARYIVFSSFIHDSLSNSGNGYSVRLIVEGEFTQQQFDDNYANKTVTINGLNYGFVYNPETNKIWLDRNLGATQVATSLTDINSYGDLFQWGRRADGHEKRSSNTTNVQATSLRPEHGDFIAFSGNWVTPGNSTLWQGANGINNPAGIAGYEKLIGKDSKKASYLDLLDKPDKPNFDELAGFDYIQTESGIGVFYNQATGDVVNPVTGMLIFNVNNVNRPTIYDGTQWNGLSYQDKQQEITVGGIYNDLELEGNILVFTNTNAQAILKGFNYDGKYKILYLINTSNFPLRLDSLDADSMVQNQIKAPNQDVSINLQGTSKMVYIDAIQKWMLLDTYGTRYMPEHDGLNEDAVVVVGQESISKSKQTKNLFVFRDNQTTEMSDGQLNTAYPDAFRGLSVICPNIGTDGVEYILINDATKKWKKKTLTNTTP